MLCVCVCQDAFSSTIFNREEFERNDQKLLSSTENVSAAVFHTTLFHVGECRVSLFSFCCARWCTYLRLCVQIPLSLISEDLPTKFSGVSGRVFKYFRERERVCV